MLNRNLILGILESGPPFLNGEGDVMAVSHAYFLRV